MIILKHITIERFRLLRALSLHFPQRGSILIQGPNEAGKTALIESIYFALYGEPLVASRGGRSLDDLILYGSSTANVTLTLAVSATELTISRALERGQGQQVSLQIRQLGMPDDEVITDLQVANERIIQELGGLDAEALRNSELIAQKSLNRLETLSGAGREKTVRKLLGMDMLPQLAEQFHVTPEDEEKLHEWQERLRLAEIQSRIPELSKQLAEIEIALDAVRINECLVEIGNQEVEITQMEQSLEEIHSQRLELKSRVGRVQHLKKAASTLTEIVDSYEDIAEAQSELPKLEGEIADLELREREELPKLEKRVNELVDLTRSFGTLQRMSNDLLTAVDTIKELEQDFKEYSSLQQDLQSLEEQIAQARSRLEKAQQSWTKLEEKRLADRPLLESRLQRLQYLAECLASLSQLEECYTQRLAKRSLAEENEQRLQKILLDLADAEREMALAEQQAQQAQQQANELETSWRQLNIRRQLTEWHRLKGLTQNLALAEQQVNQARQQQEQLTKAAIEARDVAMYYMMFTVACGITSALCLVLSFTVFWSIILLAALTLVVAVGFAIGGFMLYQNYRKLRQHEAEAKKYEQEAISQVGLKVAAREAAMRMSGNNEALYNIENEIRELGGNIPQSVEEAQKNLENMRDQSDPGTLQQRLQAQFGEADAARSQVNALMEKLSSLRKERTLLEEQRKKEQLGNFEEQLREDQAAVERMQQEITLLAGQESLPLPSINARLQASPVASDNIFPSGALPVINSIEDISSIPSLEILVDNTIKATANEIASLDGKQDFVNDLAAQTRMHQEALDALLDRQHVIKERTSRYTDSPPEAQLERAREQQVALQSALQSLRDSLRQRVKPLGIPFLQSAISNAESDARRQLEELYITLGNKVMLQERQEYYDSVLNDRQEALSELYKQLAKFSNTLGSWIVPLNPFAEALVGLRTRCYKELEEANEARLLKEQESLNEREGATKVKIELCQQEIAGMKDTIANFLDQHNRPHPKSYDRAALIAVWPLLEEYAVEDRQCLEDEQAGMEKDLEEHERQELILGEQLGTGHTPLDIEQIRTQEEQQERAYLTKKHGNRMIAAVEERLIQKILPHTEYYMQQILPLLTGRRYHDVHLVTEAEEGMISGGPLQIQVWDSAAGEYLPSSSLSGGASDQLSLALRLAFAIASLPRELNSAPGFVLLDEPLSSFDRGRAQALVDVVTGDVLGQHFEQIILVSHSSAFDPALFPYHLYMDNGLMVESNLPVVPVAPSGAFAGKNEMVTPLPVTLESDDDESDDDEPITVRTPAVMQD